MARILVADDDSAIRDVIVATCQLDKHEVRGCETCQDAIAAYAAFAPDIMILDVRMPGGGALAILESIEKARGGPACPAIVVSGDPLGENGVRPEHPRIVELIQKPFGIDALRIAVKTALGSGR